MARSGIKTDFPCQEHSDIVDRPATESVSARVKNETMYPSYKQSDKQSVLVDIPGTESLMSRPEVKQSCKAINFRRWSTDRSISR